VSSTARRASIDNTPWNHPFLTADHIARFRDYSDIVQADALDHRAKRPRQLDAAFAVNMAQSMYKWASLAKKHGSGATLYLHPQDHTAISRPEWEEFNGEYPDVLDGAGFLASTGPYTLNVPVVEPPNEGSELLSAYASNRALPFWKRALKEFVCIQVPQLAMRVFRYPELAALVARSPSVRHKPLLQFEGMYPNFRFAEGLSRHDVIYAASAPFPAYASGKPYCIFSVGGDLQFDVGRADDYGSAMRLAFASARFILVSNPHTLGHCRRLGLHNAVYLPYPMDTERYAPGEGTARRQWMERYGGSVYVLTTSRIDKAVKGHSDDLFSMVAELVRDRSELRFVFLGWGAEAEALRQRIAALGLAGRLIVLPPVGKARLIDYYRSSDVVLDTFVYGYYGATALEAAAVAKPVIMKLRAEHYAPLYRGDVAPVLNASTPSEVRECLVKLADSEQLRLEHGAVLRDWIVRTHGEQKTTPLMLALLQLAADRQPAGSRADNPLRMALSAEEHAYHRQCLQ
jgi:glycosyltransferase involved in cell wall biosynthesis